MMRCPSGHASLTRISATDTRCLPPARRVGRHRHGTSRPLGATVSTGPCTIRSVAGTGGRSKGLWLAEALAWRHPLVRSSQRGQLFDRPDPRSGAVSKGWRAAVAGNGAKTGARRRSKGEGACACRMPWSPSDGQVTEGILFDRADLQTGAGNYGWRSAVAGRCCVATAPRRGRLDGRGGNARARGACLGHPCGQVTEGYLFLERSGRSER